MLDGVVGRSLYNVNFEGLCRLICDERLRSVSMCGWAECTGVIGVRVCSMLYIVKFLE